MNYKILTTVFMAGLAMLVPEVALADPITIVASVASISSGAAAWGAATGFAAFAAGAQIAGGALSLLGAVTGNEKLTKIGGIAQLAGGIGTVASKLSTPAQVANGGLSAAESAADVSLVDKVNDVANIPGGGSAQVADVSGAFEPNAAGGLTRNIPAINSATPQPPGLLARTNEFFKNNADTIKVVGPGISGAINNIFDPKNDLYDAQAEQAKASAERERSLIGQSERDKAAISASLNGVSIPVNPLASGQPIPNMPVGNTGTSPQNPLRFIPRPLIRRI